MQFVKYISFIAVGFYLVAVGNAWQSQDTSMDIVLATLGGCFIGGTIVLVKTKHH